jgi:hypothetical protein
LTTTVTTTTVTTVAVMGLGVALGVVAVLMLIGLLGVKEFVSGNGGKRLGLLTRSLDVAIVPLLMVFSFIAITKALNVL